MATASCWPTEQPPADRTRIDSPAPGNTLHIRADSIQDRLTIHAKWAMNKRPELVQNAMRLGTYSDDTPPPLQKYGIQVYLPLDETDPNKLLPIVAGYLNLSSVSQLSLLWKSMEPELETLCDKQKKAYGASDEYAKAHPDHLAIKPATLMRLLTTSVITEENVHPDSIDETLAEIQDEYWRSTNQDSLNVNKHAQYFHFAALLRTCLPKLISELPASLRTLGINKVFTGTYRINVPDYGILCHETDAIWTLYDAEDVFRFYMLWRAFDLVKTTVATTDAAGVTIVPECNDIDVVLPLFAVRPGNCAATTALLDLES